MKITFTWSNEEGETRLACDNEWRSSLETEPYPVAAIDMLDDISAHVVQLRAEIGKSVRKAWDHREELRQIH